MFHPELCGNFHWLDPKQMLFKKKVFISDGAEVKSKYFNVSLTVQEPEYFRRIKNRNLIRLHRNFNLILTSEPCVLNNCKNAVKMLYGTTFLEETDRVSIEEKENEISFICGTRICVLAGHHLRKEVWKKESDIKYAKTFWTSREYPMDSSHRTIDKRLGAKIDTLKAKYHICIENSKIENYFTEKLMDCFMTYTIPIYWGCPNIADYFDSRGMFIVDNLDQLIECCNSVNHNLYESKLEYVKSNYQLCQKYCVKIENRLQEIIDKYID